MGVAANWGGTLPTLAGDSWVFNVAGTGGATLSNTITGQVINSTGLVFNSTTPAYTLNGNGITLGTTVDVKFDNSSANLQTINLPLTMVTDLAVTGVGGVTLGGTIGLSGGSTTTRTIRNDLTVGNLIISGNISLADAVAKTWTLAGSSSGTTFLTGNITNGGAGIGSITIQPTNRAMTVVMSGTNTYTGRTIVAAGTLRLDFSTAAVTDHIINNAANTGALTVGGGTLAITGKSGVTNNQRFASTTFGTLTYRAGAVRVAQNGATALNVTLGALTRNTIGVTVDFTLPTAGSISTTSTGSAIGANNVLAVGNVAFGTVDGGTWATNTSGTIGALANASYQTAFTAATGDTNITASATPAAFTTNTLRFNTASTALTLNSSGASTVTSGGILVTANGGGSSIVSGGGSAGLAVGAGKELVIFNYAPSSGGLPSFTVSAPILDNATSGLTVTGPGVTKLTGTNTYTGVTTVSGGVLDVGTIAGTSNAQLGTGGLVLSTGGILQGNGSFTRAFSGSSTPGVNLVGGADGGFAAKGGNLTLNFGGATAEVAMSLGVSRLGGNFILGSVNSDAAVIVVNPLDLQGATNGQVRIFTVNPGAGTASDYAELQGVIRDGLNTVTTPVFTKSGTGTLILSASNTFVGVTTINAGTLQLGNPTTNSGTTGSISSTLIVNNGTLAFNRSDTLTVGAAISGTGAVNQIGSGTTIVTATNTYTGITTINSGSTLQLGVGAGGGSAGNISSSANVVNNGTLVLNRSGSPLFSAPVSGSGAVNVIGAGTVILGGNSTYTGATTISAGTLQVGNAGTTGSISGTSGITNNATLSFNRTNLLTVSTNITGSGIVNQIGTGITSLSGANSYLGGTNVNAGTLSYLNTGARPATGITTVAAGATLGLGVATSGSFFTSADVDSLFAGTLTNVTNSATSFVGIDTTAGNFTYASSVPVNTRGLTKLGTNTLTLTSVNSYTGVTTISSGALDVGTISSGALAASGLQFANDGVLQGNGSFTRVFTGAATAAAGQISGLSGGFAARGGTLTVNFGGAGSTILISTSNFRFGTNFVFGSATADSKVIVVNPLDLNQVSRTFTVNSGVGGDSAELQGVISESGGTLLGITKAGAGLLILSATNTYTGATTISAGTLQLGSGTGGSAFGAINFTSGVVNNSVLTYNRSNTTTPGYAISGTGVVNSIGNGIVTLSGTNTYSGGTNVSGGTLNTGALIYANTNTKPATGTTTVAAGATLGLGVATSGSFFTSADVDSLFAGTLTNVNNSSTSFVGIDTTAGDFTCAMSVAANTRGLTKLGTNTLSLSGTNAYTGATTVSSGILRLDSAGALPGGIGNTGGTSNLVMNGGILGLTSSSGDFTRNTGTGATQVRWITDSVSGFAAFGGNRNVNFGGAGATVTWSNGGGVIGNGLILGDSTSDSTITVVNPIALSNGGSSRTITVNDGSTGVDAVMSGIISSLITANNGTRLTKNGAGTLALTAANTYVSGNANPGTTISAGTLMLGNGGTTGSISALTGTGINSDVTISSGATFAFNRIDNALVVANTITGVGVVNQIGTGTTTLSGANTYSGGTSVINGTLFITNTTGSATGTGAVTTAASTILGGTGTISPTGSSSVIIGGNVAPGVGGVSSGTLNFTPVNGNVTFQSGSSVAFELFSNGVNDKINFNALGSGLIDFTLMTSGKLGVTFASSYTPSLNDSFDLLDWAAVSGLGISGLSDSLLNLSTAGFDPSWIWDTSQFASLGVIVIAVPEPSRMLFFSFGAVWLCLRRRR